jgi:hypothetical protein
MSDSEIKEGTVVETDSENSLLSLTCAICNEQLESYHQIVSSENCKHTFHVICSHVWSAKNRNCPVCNSNMRLPSKTISKTVFMTALILSHDMAIECAAYTYAFLSLMLRRFNTAKEWKNARDIIIMASEQFEYGITRLPFLNLHSIETAHNEKRKWRSVFFNLTGEPTSSSDRIKTARRWLIDKLIFMLQD